MEFLKHLPESQISTLLHFYKAGIFGPFFHGLIWESSMLPTLVGPDFPQLEVIAEHWPALDTPEFYSAFRCRCPEYLGDATPENVSVLSLAAFYGVNYWLLDCMKSEKCGIASNLAPIWHEWVGYSVEDAETAFDFFEAEYDAFLRTIRKPIILYKTADAAAQVRGDDAQVT